MALADRPVSASVSDAERGQVRAESRTFVHTNTEQEYYCSVKTNIRW